MNVIFREYDPATGEIIRAGKSINFGTGSKVKVFDVFVTGSAVQSMDIILKSPGAIPEKRYAGGDVQSSTGSFGVEVSTSLESKTELTQFFSGVGAAVSLPVTNGVSDYLYLSVDPGQLESAGDFQYSIRVYRSNYVLNSSSSQSTSQSSSSYSSSTSLSNSLSSSSSQECPTIEYAVEASDVASGDHFGYSVAIDSPYAIVGAPFKDVGAISQAGKAYLYRWNGTMWRRLGLS